MRTAHRVIAVEDSEETKKELERTLRLLVCPSELLWIRSAAEAEVVLGLRGDAPATERGCLLCVDVALPYEAGEEPDPEGGFLLLKKVRARYTRQELPAIVMTAFPDGFKRSVRALTSGADHFLGKPLRLAGVNDPPAEAAITALLERECERAHRACPNVGGRGSGAQQRRRWTKKGREYATSHTVFLDGRRGVGLRRHLVRLNGDEHELTATGLRIVYALAEHDLSDGDGFLKADKLGLTYAADKICDLKKELKALGLGDLIESRGGAHRLSCSPMNVTYDPVAMRAFDWFKPKARPAEAAGDER